MVVVVALVERVAVAVVRVVDVVAVPDRDVPASVAVLVLVALAYGMAARLALVEVALVGAVEVPVMGEVDVVAVVDRGVAAALAVMVVVRGVLQMWHGKSSLGSGVVGVFSVRARPEPPSSAVT